MFLENTVPRVTVHYGLMLPRPPGQLPPKKSPLEARTCRLRVPEPLPKSDSSQQRP